MDTQNSDCIKMIEAAIKAPSGHNSQPWLFKIQDNIISIYPNMKEALPIVDKSNRELFISLGAATENLCIRASSLGYISNVEIDETNSRIKIHLVKSLEYNDNYNSLCEYIPIRQTNRNLYSGKLIPNSIIDNLISLYLHDGVNRYVISKKDLIFDLFKFYILKGNEMQMSNEDFKDELLRYIRFNTNSIKKNPTGLTYKVMGAPSMPSPLSRFITRLCLTPNNQNKGDIKKIESSSHLVMFTTKNNALSEWINLGRSLQLFTLTTTQLGIASAYMNQPCEVDQLSLSIQDNIKLLQNEYPTLLLRIGYAKPAPFSPRKKVEDVIIK